MNIDLCSFLHRLFNKSNATILVSFYNSSNGKYKDKAWVRRREGTEVVEYTHDLHQRYFVWGLDPGHWFLDSIDTNSVMNRMVHLQVSYRSDRDRR